MAAMIPGVFPTRVGMNRGQAAGVPFCARIPHTRGDEPFASVIFAQAVEYSPHAWG